jgi:glycosyltransferase involved in cell wall biosynthesis
MFSSIGWKVYVPSDKEPNYFGYGLTVLPSRGEATFATLNELIDIKPDVVLCLCWEQITGAINTSKVTGATLVVRAGNNGVPYNSSHSDFLISNDTHTYNQSDIKNKLLFYLPPDYDFYHKLDRCEDSFIVPSYIHFYEKYWRESWGIYNTIRQINQDIAFIPFGVSDNNRTPHLLFTTDVRRTLGISRLLLHIKELEGYGWSLLEAISCGIPVVASKVFTVGKTCEHFLIEGKTVRFLYNGASEFRTIFDDIEDLNRISEEGPKFIREFINEEEQYTKIRTFFEEVVLG